MDIWTHISYLYGFKDPVWNLKSRQIIVISYKKHKNHFSERDTDDPLSKKLKVDLDFPSLMKSKKLIQVIVNKNNSLNLFNLNVFCKQIGFPKSTDCFCWMQPWTSRASGRQTQRANCNYLKTYIFENYFNKNKQEVSVGL